MTIAEEFLLLAHSEDEGKPLIGTTELHAALAGALLAELAVRERVTIEGKTVSVVSPAPLGDDELDAVLTRIAEDRKERKPDWWVGRVSSSKLRQRLLTRLADRGVLSEKRGKVLGIFPTTKWPEADGRVEAEVRERVSAALTGAAPDARTAVLIALLYASKLDRKAFPGVDRNRFKEIAEGDWAGAAVAKAIAAVNAAIMAAVTTAATSAATTAGSS